MSRAFSAHKSFWANEPRAALRLPWAGMSDAYGVKHRGKVTSACSEEFCHAPPWFLEVHLALTRPCLAGESFGERSNDTHGNSKNETLLHFNLEPVDRARL